MRRRSVVFLLAAAILMAPGLSTAQSLAEFEARLTEFTLDNGLKFLVFERHDAPVVSFVTHANVGSVDEQLGITGIAHVFEHMAFKGTSTIGTKNYREEKKVLEKIDRVFEALRREKLRGHLADSARIRQLTEEFARLEEEADRWIEHDEFERAIEKEGGTSLNATTGPDATRYFYSLPANKLELWMSLESERFRDPVLREFFREKNVVLEELRLGQNNPLRRLIEDLQAVAYEVHPYGRPVIGYKSDLELMTRQQAYDFFRRYYGANNLTIAIVGDVNPAEVKRLAQIYFGRLPKTSPPDPVITEEPEQEGERRFELEAAAQPFVIMAFHRPSVNHPDDAVFEVLTDILGLGRTSRLYTRLVKKEKIAVQASAFSGLTGEKYPGLFVCYAVPSRGHSSHECEASILDEIEKIKREPVTAEELQKAKDRARANLVRQLQSNLDLAIQLAYYQVITGDWRNLFKKLDEIQAVTTEDVMRVAKTYLTKRNRTVGHLVPTFQQPAN
ncbi:MAG: insulinase family protein [candidate division KSB1 bacterium]|nr:insulinase family protein [candidate division KSB1 bacterium]